MNSSAKTIRQSGRILVHVFVTLFALVMIYPVLWMLSSSLKDTTEIFTHAHQLIPLKWNFDNYVNGFKGFAGISFSVFFKNSFIITILSVIGTVISSTMVAYGFARIRFKWASFWFGCMMLTMMLPGEVLMIPQYIFFHKIGWINTFLPLIVPAFFGGAFFIFLTTQFLRGIPKELDESAYIDGCDKYQIFIRIMVPLLVPAIITVSIFKFYWTWDDFFSPLLYLNSPKLATVSLAIKNFSDPTMKTDWGAMFAMSILSLVPIVVVFFVFQKYIVEGISTTGLKG
ncbi:carbohydrate ABC transporter permease [Paenibacillus radicis (ex Xue et al. 2023)]|uniref:Carbohydrate ABC transporter permease n=1 Tax=Paenibacillus radicis (ex Xue et al. 2023) TaxID=2972489 RepID=A0ABT1YH76_9BACL|nr:carbohydrate ABC transporter permease [Paenibacillus radicis (ex Xue et al. 2023)]MCR8632544.1 carbohydrate ABC transporter permease [Paenibacillus radicis (ex Xue et al. 2023)]